MEYLFNLVDPYTGGDPARNSLFNLSTLKTLVAIGLNTTNIINEPDMIYEQNFRMSQEWVNLAATLMLDQKSSEIPEIGTKRTYLLWLWMQSMWDMTFTRVLPVSQGGSY